MFVHLPSDIASQKTATFSTSISKALKHAIPSKPTKKLAESKRYFLVTLWGDSEIPKGHLSLLPPYQVKIKKAVLFFLGLLLSMIKKNYAKLKQVPQDMYSIYTKLTLNM